MNELQIGNVIIGELCGAMAIYVRNDMGCIKPESIRPLGYVADGSSSDHVLDVLGGYYDHVAPIDGWEVAFQDVIVMARLFCIPLETVLAAA